MEKRISRCIVVYFEAIINGDTGIGEIRGAMCGVLQFAMLYHKREKKMTLSLYSINIDIIHDLLAQIDQIQWK